MEGFWLTKGRQLTHVRLLAIASHYGFPVIYSAAIDRFFDLQAKPQLTDQEQIDMYAKFELITGMLQRIKHHKDERRKLGISRAPDEEAQFAKFKGLIERYLNEDEDSAKRPPDKTEPLVAAPINSDEEFEDDESFFDPDIYDDVEFPMYLPKDDEAA